MPRPACRCALAASTRPLPDRGAQKEQRERGRLKLGARPSMVKVTMGYVGHSNLRKLEGKKRNDKGRG